MVEYRITIRCLSIEKSMTLRAPAIIKGHGRLRSFRARYSIQVIEIRGWKIGILPYYSMLEPRTWYLVHLLDR